MALDVRCGQCGKQYRLKDELAGKRLKCSQCGQPIMVPAAGGAAPQPAAAPRRAPAAPAPSAPAPPLGNVPSGSLHDLLDDATVGALVAPTMVMPGQMLCQNCHKAIPMGASVCTQCGFDFRAGKSMGVAVDKPRDPRTQAFISAMIAFGIMIGVNLLAGALLGIAYFCWKHFDLLSVKLPWRNFGISVAFLGGVMSVLFSLSLLADAFKEGMGCGLRYLLLPGYSLYFILTRWQVCRKSYFMIVLASCLLLMGGYVYLVAPPPKDDLEKQFQGQARVQFGEWPATPLAPRWTGQA